MKKLAIDLQSLRIKDGLSQNHYKKEAREMMRRFRRSDRNFKYFFMEFISLAKENVETDALRETISELQRYVCLRINQEHSADSEPSTTRNRTRCSKKIYFRR